MGTGRRTGLFSCLLHLILSHTCTVVKETIEFCFKVRFQYNYLRRDRPLYEPAMQVEVMLPYLIG